MSASVFDELLSPRNTLEWWVISGAGAFLLMSWDKFMAIMGAYRVSERDLQLAGLAGGFLGVFAGGLFLRHKTRKPDFWIPVYFSAALWVVILVYELHLP